LPADLISQSYNAPNSISAEAQLEELTALLITRLSGVLLLRKRKAEVKRREKERRDERRKERRREE